MPSSEKSTMATSCRLAPKYIRPTMSCVMMRFFERRSEVSVWSMGFSSLNGARLSSCAPIGFQAQDLGEMLRNGQFWFTHSTCRENHFLKHLWHLIMKPFMQILSASILHISITHNPIHALRLQQGQGLSSEVAVCTMKHRDSARCTPRNSNRSSSTMRSSSASLWVLA